MPKSNHRKKAPVILKSVTKSPYTFIDDNGEEFTLTTAQKFWIIHQSPPSIPIPDERLALAERYARGLFGFDAKPIKFGVNPPTDERVIRCLKRVGQGWTDDTHGHIICDVDVTEDIRVVFNQLDKLNTPRAEGEEEPPIDRDALRVVGAKLNDIGGMRAMLDAVDILKVMVGDRVSRLGWAWDKIGEWKW